MECRPKLRLLPSIPNVSLGIAYFTYSKAIKIIITNAKFNGNKNIAQLIPTAEGALKLPECIKASDWIVPVRSHWVKRLYRGGCHMTVLFKELSNLPNYLPNGITRLRFSNGSYGLSKKARIKMKKKSQFKLSSKLKGVQSVTILDDICTTGATITQIARDLKKIGVDTVMVVVIAQVEITPSLK